MPSMITSEVSTKLSAVEVYPQDTIVVYDPSLWRMRLCHKSTISLAIRLQMLPLVLKTSMTESDTSK